MAGISIEFTNLPEFIGAFQRGPVVVQEELFRSARTIALQGEALSKMSYTAGRWTGNAINSIYGKAEQTGDGAAATFGASAEYAIVIDQGRRAGAKMPPKGALLAWMQAKGIPADREFLVRRKIARSGIPAKPFVTKAFDQLAAGPAEKEFGNGLTRAIARIGGE